MDRRKFIRSGGAICGIGATAAIILLESCGKDGSPQGPTVNFTLDLSLPQNSVLNNTGGQLTAQGVVIANTGSGFVVLAQKCTHEGCSVQYNNSANNFVCPCHNGKFDLNGNVVSGPPPSPLKKYTVTQNGTVLTISG
jgi:cytochrome b6-f complex iron-sulfur subunit